LLPALHPHLLIFQPPATRVDFERGRSTYPVELGFGSRPPARCHDVILCLEEAALELTDFLGGAVLTHVRVGDPLFSHVLFPVYIGALIWGGLFLRNRLQALVVDVTNFVRRIRRARTPAPTSEKKETRSCDS
jgi:hypothetical protein